jgi:ribonuclease P protein component
VISSEYRFHGRASLKFVYQNGQVIRGPFFSVKYALNPKRKNYRAAVVVSRKVDKSAVVRNRLRRRLYEALRLQQDRITQPVDIVITVFNVGLDELAPAKLERQLKDQLKAAKILGPKTPAL